MTSHIVKGEVQRERIIHRLYGINFNMMPNGVYTERAIELLQHSFAPMYRRVWQQIWNDGQIAVMRQPYIYTDFQGVYEVYIPVALDPEGFVHYLRVIVKIVEEISEETVRKEQSLLMQRMPACYVDSETIFYLAQRGNGERVNGFRFNNNGFAYIIVDSSPEEGVRRIKAFIMNFLYKRFLGLLRKLNLYGKDQKFLDVSIMEFLTDMKAVKRTLYFSINNYESKLHSFSLVIQRMAQNFIRSVLWLLERSELLTMEIERISFLKTKFKPFIANLRQKIEALIKPNPMRSEFVKTPSLILKLAAVLNERG